MVVLVWGPAEVPVSDKGGGLLNREGSRREVELWLRLILADGKFFKMCSIWLEGLSAGFSRLCWLDSRSIRLFSLLSSSAASDFFPVVTVAGASLTQFFFKLSARCVDRVTYPACLTSSLRSRPLRFGVLYWSLELLLNLFFVVTNKRGLITLADCLWQTSPTCYNFCRQGGEPT